MRFAPRSRLGPHLPAERQRAVRAADLGRGRAGPLRRAYPLLLPPPPRAGASPAAANANALASAQATAAAAAANTPLAKFISLFTSQVYAQLATQLSNNLFQAGGSSNTGTFNLDGNTISYIKTGTNVQLTVVDSSGNQTVVNVPIATFAF